MGNNYPNVFKWIDDRSPTEKDADAAGYVLVDDLMNNRIRRVRLICVDHFLQWMPLPKFKAQ